MTGAIRNMGLSAPAGMMSSLSMSLIGSATACSTPHGPTRIGPTLACMNARILRSRYTRYMITTDSTMNTIRILMVSVISG